MKLPRRALAVKRALIGPMPITIHVTYTRRSYAPRSEWHMYDESAFTLPDARGFWQWCRDVGSIDYTRVKRVKMYQGQGVHVGYVFSFRVCEPNDRHLEAHWVKITPSQAIEEIHHARR